MFGKNKEVHKCPKRGTNRQKKARNHFKFTPSENARGLIGSNVLFPPVFYYAPTTLNYMQ
jgi:hypothetical protein